MNTKLKIKAIIFDVGGVLQLPKYPTRLIQDSHLSGVPKHCGHRNKGIHEYLANKLKIVLDQWFDAIDTYYALSIEGKISEKELMSRISKNLHVSQGKLKGLIIKAYKRQFILNKELINVASKLKKQGYKVGILSDQWQLSKRALMPKSLTKKFNPVLVSCDNGIRKPNKDYYKLLLKRLKLKPSQIVFIDNQEWNIKPAKKLGIKTILFKNNKQAIKSLEKLGVKIK